MGRDCLFLYLSFPVYLIPHHLCQPHYSLTSDLIPVMIPQVIDFIDLLYTYGPDNGPYLNCKCPLLVLYVLFHLRSSRKLTLYYCRLYEFPSEASERVKSTKQSVFPDLL